MEMDIKTPGSQLALLSSKLLNTMHSTLREKLLFSSHIITAY